MRLASSSSSSSGPEDLFGNASKMQKMLNTLVTGIIPVTDAVTNLTQDSPNIVMIPISQELNVSGSDQSAVSGKDPLLPSQKETLPQDSDMDDLDDNDDDGTYYEQPMEKSYMRSTRIVKQKVKKMMDAKKDVKEAKASIPLKESSLPQKSKKN